MDVQHNAALTYPTYQVIRFRQYIKELERDFQIEVDYYYLQIISIFLNAWIHQTHVPINEKLLMFNNSIKEAAVKRLSL